MCISPFSLYSEENPTNSQNQDPNQFTCTRAVKYSRERKPFTPTGVGRPPRAQRFENTHSTTKRFQRQRDSLCLQSICPSSPSRAPRAALHQPKNHLWPLALKHHRLHRDLNRLRCPLPSAPARTPPHAHEKCCFQQSLACRTSMNTSKCSRKLMFSATRCSPHQPEHHRTH